MIATLPWLKWAVCHHPAASVWLTFYLLGCIVLKHLKRKRGTSCDHTAKSKLYVSSLSVESSATSVLYLTATTWSNGWLMARQAVMINFTHLTYTVRSSVINVWRRRICFICHARCSYIMSAIPISTRCNFLVVGFRQDHPNGYELTTELGNDDTSVRPNNASTLASRHTTGTLSAVKCWMPFHERLMAHEKGIHRQDEDTLAESLEIQIFLTAVCCIAQRHLIGADSSVFWGYLEQVGKEKLGNICNSYRQ